MASLFGFAHDTPYAERARILSQHGIALWDVIQGCKRHGSLDSSIDNQSIVANDFVSFYRKHPHIRRVFFNGTKAEHEYRKRVLPACRDCTRHRVCQTPLHQPGHGANVDRAETSSVVAGTTQQFDKPRLNSGAARRKLWSRNGASYQVLFTNGAPRLANYSYVIYAS